MTALITTVLSAGTLAAVLYTTDLAAEVALAVLAGFRFFRGDVAPFFCLVCLAMQSLLGSVSPTKVGGVGRTGNSNRRVEKRQARSALFWLFP